MSFGLSTPAEQLVQHKLNRAASTILVLSKPVNRFFDTFSPNQGQYHPTRIQSPFVTDPIFGHTLPTFEKSHTPQE
jgi:hypothetical protein